jgi:membrane carboxypeptidase/penicillin-binding protein
MSVYFLKRWSLRLLRASLVLGVLLLIGGMITAGVVYWRLTRDLPKISTLRDYRPPVITTVYADDGRVIGEFFKERRIVVPLSRIPERLIQAFVAAEDSRFYQHQGVDLLSIVRAFFKNLEAGTKLYTQDQGSHSGLSTGADVFQRRHSVSLSEPDLSRARGLRGGSCSAELFR